jgi:hypothetical protein
MTDDLIEAVAQALAISWFGSGIDEVAVTKVRPEAIAVIRAAAPLILDMAAEMAEECWEWGVPPEKYADSIRGQKEWFK